MTALRERMIEDLQLHGYADKTKNPICVLSISCQRITISHQTGSQRMNCGDISSI